ncbi:transposase [Brevibacillus sp. 7WMA2]|uniref:DnaD domain protein n=1 Tax=Brevibacillus sp. 7WMA2 TaxID=2683193 RepID=UPI0013A78B30|nr:DnaD domain protein [Brevibacillus sp. 7WMA2]QIC07764.1 transposase [Brevibacillus sp. 7WMA2]
MRVMWNELAPNDRYLVRFIRPLSMMEMGFITHLYLPLLGVSSYSLYQLLMHEVDEKSGAASEGTHRSLMMMTSLPLDRLLQARERLEAMDLLKVRRRENREHDFFYEYIVLPPLTPAQFFQEDILPVMLLNQVGKVKYEQLRRTYADQLWGNLAEEYPYEEDVTKRFYEVYHNLSASELEIRPGSETDRFFAHMQEKHPTASLANHYEAEPDKQLDLSFLRASLPSHVQASKVVTQESIPFFYQLLAFYQVDSYLLSQELRDWNLYDSQGTLSTELLRKRIRERYVNNQLTRERRSLADAYLEHLGPGKIPAPGTEVFLRICRELSPLIILEQAVGGRISRAFLERAESLVFTDSMPSEVVNALLLYAMRETKMELPKAYVETIRDSWKAKAISTVEEAVRVILERAEAKNQAMENQTVQSLAASQKGGLSSNRGRRSNSRALLQDKLPAAVQRQLDREEAEAVDTDRKKRVKQVKKTIMDDPELKELYESLRQPMKGGEH